MKARKFASGGYQAEPNRNITDDVRARAMRFLQGETELSGKYHSSEDKPAQAKKSPPQKTASARPSKPTPPKPTPLQQDIMNMNRQLAAARKQREAREAETLRFQNDTGMDYPAGLETQYMGTQDRPLRLAKGGKVSSVSKRADGIAKKGKTRGKVC
jgi:hypothetical protein